MSSFGPHVFALAEILAGQPVEQAAVDVVADAEGEHAGADLVGLLRRWSTMADFVRFADGRQAVGEEQDVVGPARRR